MTQIENVQRSIRKLRREVTGRPYLLHSEIKGLVDQYFKKLGVVSDIEKIDTKRKDHISVGGEYLIGRVRQPIHIQIAVSKHSDRVNFTYKTLEGFLFLLYQILLHELRHKYQYLFRDADSHLTFYMSLDDHKAEMTEEQMYLAEFDELDSYAGDIAQELVYFCPDTWRQEMTKITNKRIQSYHYYAETFAGTEWSEIRNQLLKKVYKHAQVYETTKGWYHYA